MFEPALQAEWMAEVVRVERKMVIQVKQSLASPAWSLVVAAPAIETEASVVMTGL
jgi:hypothetical protein